jgi:phage/plasmid-like protein (TIGR03299 family)
MFSVKQMPWHQRKECVVLDAPPTDTLDALGKSGLGWGVRQEPVYRRVELPDGDGGTVEIYTEIQDAEDVRWQLNARSDTGAVLGVVTESYKPVQNVEAFTFLDALLGGDVEFETAGSYAGGKRVWVLARIPGHVELAGDATERFIYAANAHDGSMACIAAPTFIRIVCKNTFNMATGRTGSGGYRFRHTGNLTAKFTEARRVLGLTVEHGKAMKQLADKLGIVDLSDKQALKVLKDMPAFKTSDGMGDRAVKNRAKGMDAILSIFHGEGERGDTRGSAPGSAWCFVQAVGEFSDYERRYTIRTNQAARSLEDNAMTQQALDRTMALVG